MPATQPTILVKKSDGTFARMSWDEFNAYRTQNTINKTPVSAPSAPLGATPGKQAKSVNELLTPKVELPAKEGEVLPATTAPVKEIFVDEAKYAKMENGKWKMENGARERKNKKEWSGDDHKSLLEQSVDDVKQKKGVETLPDKRDDLYSLFIKEIRFPVKDEMRGRLNSLVVSFVKGVRTEEQVTGYLQRGEKDGGLGFSEAQTEAAIAAIKKVWHLALASETTKEPKLPAVETVDVAAAKAARQKIKSVAGPDVPRVGAKPMVRDVAPPKVQKVENVPMGPIDEIATMTLIDFRRLATGGTDSIHVLRDKFSALRKESIVLYLQAQQAWFSSPLYREYQSLITRAVNERRKLQEVVGESGGIRWEEFIKIAEVGRRI